MEKKMENEMVTGGIDFFCDWPCSKKKTCHAASQKQGWKISKSHQACNLQKLWWGSRYYLRQTFLGTRKLMMKNG